MNERSLKEIPAAACTLVVGEFELGDNGEGAKSAPIRLVARSGQPIEHWFWGRVVHDLAGMHMHKPRLPIDYVHDAKEIIGYLNRFETDSGDLVTSGALVPYKENDRAAEILHKMAEGVPYEASINFGGDGIKVQEVGEGELTEVNGYQFEGPGCVVREWPLRGVAVCPYGADMNTESASAFSNSKQVFSASVVPEPEAPTKENAMSESVEVEAQVVTPEAEASEESSPVEEVSAEELTEAVEESPEVESVEAPDAAEELAEDEPTEEPNEFVRIADEFGSEIAVQVARDGGSYEDARTLHFAALAQENEELRAKLSESAAASTGKPAVVVVPTKRSTIFKTGK